MLAVFVDRAPAAQLRILIAEAEEHFAVLRRGDIEDIRGAEIDMFQVNTTRHGGASERFDEPKGGVNLR